jgi:integrase
MEIRWDGHRRPQRSYLSELLDLANGTARRISAICRLRYEDLRLAATPACPHGAIRWPEDTDKEGKEWVAPVNATVRTALDRILRERPGIGSAYLFPSPKTPSEPITKDLAREWLLEAERLAELPKLSGGTWHPYRRKWATARKHLPLKDVAAAGGWKCTETLLRCYQQTDEETILDVVLGGAELRERKA